MQVKTVRIPPANYNNNVFPQTFDEFISALSICEIFLFNDRNSRLITRQMRNNSQAMFDEAEDLLRRIYQRFSPSHIEQIKDKKFIDSLNIIQNFYIKYKMFGRIKFKDDEHDAIVTESKNMWDMFNKNYNQNLSLKNWHPDKEFIELYRNYRSGIKSEPKVEENIIPEPKVEENIIPNLKKVIDEPEDKDLEIFKNFSKNRIPTPEHLKPRLKFRKDVDPKMLATIQQVKEGRCKNLINKILYRSESDVEELNKSESNEKFDKTIEDTYTMLQSLNAQVEKLEILIETNKKLEQQISTLQTKHTTMEMVFKKWITYFKEKEIKERSEALKPKSFWQKIVSWFR